VLPEDGVFHTKTCRNLLMSILKLFLRLSNCASVGETLKPLTVNMYVKKCLLLETHKTTRTEDVTAGSG